MDACLSVCVYGQTLVALGDFSDYHIWLALVGLVLTGTLLFHQVAS